MSTTKTSVDVRVDASEKASWQAEADAAGVSVSELVRSRMSVPRRTDASLDISAPELQSLRLWLDLSDSDGEVDAELLAEWQAFAARSCVTFPELLKRVVVDANAALV
jgi:hypothetical protein